MMTTTMKLLVFLNSWSILWASERQSNYIELLTPYDYLYGTSVLLRIKLSILESQDAFLSKCGDLVRPLSSIPSPASCRVRIVQLNSFNLIKDFSTEGIEFSTINMPMEISLDPLRCIAISDDRSGYSVTGDSSKGQHRNCTISVSIVDADGSEVISPKEEHYIQIHPELNIVFRAGDLSEATEATAAITVNCKLRRGLGEYTSNEVWWSHYLQVFRATASLRGWSPLTYSGRSGVRFLTITYHPM
jgi:hypothetical protein